MYDRYGMPQKRYFTGWWFWFILMMVFSIIVFTGLRYFGIIGQTIVEREVFKRSYQYTEANKSAANTYTAQLTEINNQLARSDLDPGVRADLESQAASIRVLLAGVRAKMNQ